MTDRNSNAASKQGIDLLLGIIISFVWYFALSYVCEIYQMYWHDPSSIFHHYINVVTWGFKDFLHIPTRVIFTSIPIVVAVIYMFRKGQRELSVGLLLGSILSIGMF